jgi:hypothetical protein
MQESPNLQETFMGLKPPLLEDGLSSPPPPEEQEERATAASATAKRNTKYVAK